MQGDRLYTLVLASLNVVSAPPGTGSGAGASSDRVARLAVGSMLSSLAPNIETMIAARLVPGHRRPMMNRRGCRIITQVFPVGGTRAVRIGAGAASSHLDGARQIVGGAMIRWSMARGVLDQPDDLRLGDTAEGDISCHGVGSPARCATSKRSGRILGLDLHRSGWWTCSVKAGHWVGGNARIVGVAVIARAGVCRVPAIRGPA